VSKLQEFLALARAEIGVAEDPPGSNCVKYNTAYYGHSVSGDAYAWCVVFIWWLMRQIGLSDLYYGGKKTANCSAIWGWARQNGLIVQEPQPGDWVLFDWNANQSPDHIGVIESADSQYINTIEGNVDSCVKRMHRARDKKIVAFIRPAWPAEPATEYVTRSELRTILQQALDYIS